jgi:hypothetical protein
MTESAAELEQAVRTQLHEPRRAARAAQLSHEPCPLEALVRMGHFIGIDACLNPGLMWLVDCALTPEMPVGWSEVPLPDGRQFYVHAACGMSQWEHPQTAFLTGVVRCLNKPFDGSEAARLQRQSLRESRRGSLQQEMSRKSLIMAEARAIGRIAAAGVQKNKEKDLLDKLKD